MYEDAYAGVLKCVLSSFTTLVSCVEGVLQDNVSNMESELENYITTVKKLAQQVVKDIQECV